MYVLGRWGGRIGGPIREHAVGWLSLKLDRVLSGATRDDVIFQSATSGLQYRTLSFNVAGDGDDEIRVLGYEDH